MKISLVTMTVLGLLGTLSTPTHASNQSVERALESRGDLSMFYQALLSTGVAAELDEREEYTLFAPTNAAFAGIQPSAYPCFYMPQCRDQVAALLRNHIVARSETINRFSKWGDGVTTIGTRPLYVEEAYKDDYTVNGYSVLSQSKGETISLYPIEGVIANDQDMMPFRVRPMADIGTTITEKTVTTHHNQAPAFYPTAYPVAPAGYLVPGGYPISLLQDYGEQTTTVTTTTTTP